MSEDTLIRYLDGEGTREARREIRRHLRRCAPCRERVRETRSLSRRTEDRLRLLDPADADRALPPTLAGLARRDRPRRRAGAGALTRAAVIALVVAGAVLLVTPAGARAMEWLAERWRGVVALVEPRDGPAREAEPASSPGAVPSEYRFVPGSGTLTLEFAAAQQEGALYLGTGSGPEAELVLLDPSEGTPLLVRAGGARLENRETSRGSYRLRLPPQTERLRLLVGEREIAVARDALAEGGPTVVPLR